jgi:hypothetical protein
MRDRFRLVIAFIIVVVVAATTVTAVATVIAAATAAAAITFFHTFFIVTAGGVIVWTIQFRWKFVLDDDSTVVGKGRFFGGSVCTKVLLFAIKIDLCFEPLPSHVHSTIPNGVSRQQSSLLRFFFAFINSSSMGNPPGKFNLEDKSLRCDLALVTEGGPENKPAEERRATTKVSAIEEQTKN